jgi:lipid-A-disaccharide synthase
MSDPTSILIVAGEASGDLHGAAVVRECLVRNPNLHFSGLGGANLRDAGTDTVVDSSSIAVVGITEVLRHRHEIKAAFDGMYREIDERQPKLAILIDSPGFNFRLAKRLVAKKIPILYYISPQVWAWHSSRIGVMKKWSERTSFKVAVVFPFEEQLYLDHDVPAEFVGHPLLDLIGKLPAANDSKLEFGLDPERPLVTLLPGSRKIEIERMLPVMLKAALLLKRKNRHLQFLLPVAKTLEVKMLRQINNEIGVDLKWIGQDERFAAISAADAAMVTSGTATVETGLCGTPMVVLYQANWLTYRLGKLILERMKGMTNIGMVNILLGDTVCPELIQDNATPEKLAAEIERYLQDAAYREETITRLQKLAGKLGRGGAAERVARIALEMSGAGELK